MALPNAATAMADVIQHQCHEAEYVESPDALTVLSLVEGVWAALLAVNIGRDFVSFESYHVDGTESRENFCTANLEQNIPFAEFTRSINRRGFSDSTSDGLRTDAPRQKSHADHALCNTKIVLETTTISHSRNDTQVPLTVVINKQATKVSICLEYRVTQFTSLEIGALSESLSQGLAVVIANPNILLDSIQLVSPDQMSYLLNRNSVYPETVNRTVHAIISERATQDPDAIAISSTNTDITYGELERLTSNFAFVLRRAGVGEGVIVPICSHKSPWAMVAMISIAKAGGAYTIILPQYPHNRIEHIMTMVDAKLVVVTPETASLISAEQQILITPEFLAGLVSTSGESCLGEVKPSDAFCVAFTSGTTGMPKAMTYEHRNAATSFQAIMDFHEINKTSRVFQYSSYNWDASLRDIFGPLMCGACVCVPTEAERSDLLAETITALRVTFVSLTPTVISLLDPRTLPTLRRLNTGGERMTQNIVDKWSKVLRLTNSYGPAEVVVNATLTRVSHDFSTPSNIGSPISSCLCWVTNPRNADILTPPGAIGELLVQGPTLARGYLNDPAKTSAAFVRGLAWQKNLGFSDEERRVYKSGDLVRLNFDGSFDYISRKDTQIKINGQRTEVTEIEVQLSTAAALTMPMHVALVTAVDRPQQQFLTAFVEVGGDVTSADGELIQESSVEFTLLASKIRSVASQHLPAYMVPSLYVPVSQTPRASTGKVDRPRLASLVIGYTWKRLTGFLGVTDKLEITTPFERSLQQLWSMLLNIDDVTSIDGSSHFIQLGGDSVAAIRLSNAARKAGLILSTQSIMEHPRLREMAAIAIKNEKGVQKQAPIPFSMINSSALNSKLLSEVAARINIDISRIRDLFPCTPLQEGLFASTLRDPAAYVSQQVYKMPPDFDVERFKAAWASAHAVTPILRSRILDIDLAGKPRFYQVVIDEDITWETGDSLAAYLSQDKAKHIDVHQKLCRFAVVSDQQDCYFVWTAHHATYDGFSMQLLASDVAKLYSGHTTATRPSFSSFVQFLEAQDLSLSRKYWQDYLSAYSGRDSLLTLPLDGSPALATETVDRRIQLACSGNKNITFSIMIRVAFALLMGRYTGSQDVVFGCTQSGRMADFEDIDQLLAPVFATVPVRISYTDNQSLTSMLEAAQTDSHQMLLHEHVGLQNLQKYNSDCEEACKFQSILIVQGSKLGKPAPFNQQLHVTNDELLAYALGFECETGADGIVVHAHFDPNIITEPMVQRMLVEFEMLLTQVVDHPDRLIKDISVLSRDEKENLLRWNKNGTKAIDECIHKVIAEQTVRTPHRIAMQDDRMLLSYSEVDQISSCLASSLVNRGIGPESIVPLCFEKSVCAAVCMLAVLKAGGACVAIDPALPDTRLSEILKASVPSLVICSKEQADRLGNEAFELISVDPDTFHETWKFGVEELNVHIHPENAAFIVFTSGSTGVPKGIVLEHRHICSTGQSMHNVQFLDSNSRVLQFSSYTYDVYIEEIFITMMYGGCVCIPTEDQRRSDLVGFMRRNEVNWVDLTPTVAGMFFPDEVPSLRTVVVGGEKLSQGVFDRWVNRVNLVFAYGPAECSVICTSTNKLTADDVITNVGWPCGGTIWIVHEDDFNKLAPIGCVGEILVGGPIVGREYLNNPTATNKVFVSDPRWAANGDLSEYRHYYRTGDLGKFNEDGTVSVLGRRDLQVKINGQRIELEDIEAAVIKTSPEGSQSLVEAILGGPNLDVKQLAVFISLPNSKPEVGDTLSVLRYDASMRTLFSAMQTEIAATLPRHMVPQLFVPLNRLPHTIGGKTDRKILRELSQKFTAEERFEFSLVSATKKLPTTVQESVMRDVWSSILGLDAQTIGVEDNFFQLGGSSIAAMHLVAATRRGGMGLAVRDVFEHPVLSALAVRMTFSDNIGTPATIAPFSLLSNDRREMILNEIQVQLGLESDAIEDAYPCTPLQQNLLTSTARDPSTYVLREIYRLPTHIDLERLRMAWEAVMRQYAILRTRIVSVMLDSDLLESYQVVLHDLPSWSSSSSTIEEFINHDKADFMNFGTALSRFAVVGDNPLDRYFVFTAHHATFDGWSQPLIYDAVNAVYHGADLHNTSDFNAFVKHVGAIDEAMSADFWQRQLENFKPNGFMALPNPDYKVQANTSSELQFANHWTSAADPRVTLSTILQAAWALVLSTHSDTRDIVFGSISTGRDAQVAGIDTIVGPTITTVPRRVQVQADEGIDEFLERVQADILDTLQYEHFGLDSIARLGFACRSAVQFRSLFVVQSESDEVDGLAKLGLRQVPSKTEGFLSLPLTTQCTPKDRKIHVKAIFDQNLISTQAVRQLLDQFSHVTTQLISRSRHTTVEELCLLGPEDMKQLRSWNGYDPTVVDRSIPDVISDFVREQPTANAVYGWDGNLTYAALDELSGKMASLLRREYQVGSNSRVPFCMHKSVWTAVVMLGILKTGAAVVPVDPNYPRIRIEIILKATGAHLIITQRQYEDHLSSIGTAILFVEEDIISSTLQHEEQQQSKARPDSPAFILFSSGTTGIPKGIILQHRAIATSSRAHAEFTKIGPGKRVLQFAAHTFDVCIQDVFTTLQNGGCVCVPSDQQRLEDLAGAITSMRVNWTFLTPTVAKILHPSEVPCLETLVLGGEATSMENISTWGRTVHLFNEYGPAEAGIVCAIRKTSQSLDAEPSNIGQSLNSIRCWVTHADNPHQLVPIGEVGELVVEGPSLASGYLDNPEKTSAAFLPTTRWAQNKQIVDRHNWTFYRTGDLVRQLEDGTITYIGRKDTQVKFHGQRLELNDIEHQIQLAMGTNCQAVVDVITPMFRQEAELLTAFIAPEQDQQTARLECAVAEAQADSVAQMALAKWRLSGILPSYAIPSLWLPITSIPTSLSKKLDRQKLKELGANLSADVLGQFSVGSQQRRAPVTAIEISLAQMWKKLLKLKESFVGLDTNFFDIGGDSIAAMKLVATTRRHGLKLSMTDIFRSPILVEMATAITTTALVPQLPHKDVLPAFQLLSFTHEPFEQYLEVVARECHVDRAQIVDAYPCTPTQEGLFVSTVSRSSLYMAQFVYRVPASVDMDRFCAAWAAVVRLLPTLRTRIVSAPTNGAVLSKSCQVVVDEPVTWHTYNDCEINTILEREMPAQINYGSKLIRFAIGEGASRHFVMTIHHALYDGWSMPRILSIFKDVFDGRPVGEIPSYAKHIEELTTIPELHLRDFWTNTLGSVEPMAFPRNTTTNRMPFIDHILQKRIPLASSRLSGILPSTVLQTAWAMVLGSHANTNDVVYHSIQSGRASDLEAVENIIGCTVTNVPVRSTLDQERPMSAQLREAQVQMSESIRYAHYGLQNIRRLGDGPASACEASSLLVVQPQIHESDDIPELVPLAGNVNGDFMNYSLVVECSLGASSVEIRMGCDSTVISAQLAERLLDQFIHAVQQLQNITEETRLAEVTTLCHEDLAILRCRNAQIPAFGANSIHHEFQSVAAAHPEQLAVDASDVQLTYYQLDQLSNSLAYQLLARGTKHQQVVPIAFEKSGWAVVALLAVAKSGCISVCFDASAPTERCLDICQTVGASFILASSQQSQRWREHFDVFTLDTNTLHSATHVLPPWSSVSANDVLYLIFTSGSTGKPKGCVVEHGSFIATINSIKQTISFGTGDRMMQYASYSFDVSILEIYQALLAGACLCVPTQQECATDVGRALREHNVTWSYLTPSLARTVQPNDVPALKVLGLVGEQVMPVDIKTWADRLTLINGYGPSECSVAATAHVGVGLTTDPSNIGFASGCVCWVVAADDHNRLCPIGVTGELIIDGPIVARGYLNDPIRTSESFLNSTDWLFNITGREKARMYKTGDLAKYNPDGTITFVGRKDNQIKVRGQRMDLGEPEHHLLEVPFVHHAVVVRGLQKSLVAVLTLRSAVAINVNNASLKLADPSPELTAHASNLAKLLTQKVPGYMVPSTWLVVESMPFLPSGKIDRKQLQRWLNGLDDADLTQCALVDEESDDALDGDTLSKLRDVVGGALGVAPEKVDLKRSFVGQGGDSISAMRVYSSLQRLNLGVEVRHILSKSSLLELARELTEIQIVPIGHDDHEKLMTMSPLSPMQSYYADYALGPDSLSRSTNTNFNYSFHFRLTRPVENATLQNALNAIVQKHSQLRARFSKDEDGSWMQLITDDIQGSYLLRCHAAMPSEDVTALVEDSRTSLDIEHGPLMRADLIGSNLDGQVLHITIHHLVTDLVSWTILIAELEEYVEKSQLADYKPAPFSKWARLLQEDVRKNWPPHLALPFHVDDADFDFWGMEGVPNTDQDSRTANIELPRDLLSRVKAKSGMENLDVLDLLNAAVAMSFEKNFSERKVPTIFNQSHGREIYNGVDVSRTMGWFSNFWPLQISDLDCSNAVHNMAKVRDLRLSIPLNGRAYFASRYYHPEGCKKFGSHHQMEFIINYLGDYHNSITKKSVFQLMGNLDSGLHRCTGPVKRNALFSIQAMVEKDCFRLTFAYNRNAKHQERIQYWIKDLAFCLVELAGCAKLTSSRD